MCKDITAYVEHDVLSHNFCDQRLRILRYILNENTGKESRDDPLESRIVTLGNVIVYSFLCENGTHFASKSGKGNS